MSEASKTLMAAHGFTEAHWSVAEAAGIDVPSLLQWLQTQTLLVINLVQGMLAWLQAHPEVVSEVKAILTLLGFLK